MADESNVPGIFKTLTSVAANRNWVSGATGVLFAFAALGAMSPEQAQAMVSGAQEIMNGLGVAVGGAKKIWLAIPAGLIATMAAWAGRSSSLLGVLTWLGNDKNKAKGIVVVAPDQVANAIPSPTILPKEIATVVVPAPIADAVKTAAPTAPVLSQ